MAESSNVAEVVIGGKKYKVKLRDYACTIAHDGVAGTTAQNVIQIDPSSPFWLTSVHMSDDNDPTTAAPGLYGQYENLVAVQDQANNYNWYNDYISRSAAAGGRMDGNKLETPMYLERNTRLLVTIKNPSAGALAGNTRFVVRGWSVY